MSNIIEPFHLAIPETQLDDLRARLARTRWPDRETVTDTSQGPPLEKIQALVAHWRDRYDWRRCETMLNEFGQHHTTRLYWESQSSMSGPPPGTMQMPTGISMFPKELVRISRRWAEKRFSNLIHFNELDAGGHFAALEQPVALTEEIRTAFRGVHS